MYIPSVRAADDASPTPRALRGPPRPASIPEPNCATGEAASIRDSCSSRTCAPSSAASSSRTVGPSHARDEARIAAAAEHREGHAPDVAGRRRRRDVEVAVGVEPGDRQARLGCAPLEAGHRARVRGAVATEEQQARVRRRRPCRPRGPPRRASTSRGRYSMIRSRFFMNGSASGAQPARSGRRRGRRAPSPARPLARRRRSRKLAARSALGPLSMPGEVAAERGRRADDRDGVRHAPESSPRRARARPATAVGRCYRPRQMPIGPLEPHAPPASPAGITRRRFLAGAGMATVALVAACESRSVPSAGPNGTGEAPGPQGSGSTGSQSPSRMAPARMRSSSVPSGAARTTSPAWRRALVAANDADGIIAFVRDRITTYPAADDGPGDTW